jgi:hypothetical protein
MRLFSCGYGNFYCRPNFLGFQSFYSIFEGIVMKMEPVEIIPGRKLNIVVPNKVIVSYDWL